MGKLQSMHVSNTIRIGWCSIKHTVIYLQSPYVMPSKIKRILG
jgi:hypothetical protein